MSVVLSIVMTAIGYVIGISLIPRILLERRQSGATLAWVLAILFLPYVGAVAFWLIGTPRYRFRRKRRLKAAAVVAPKLAASTLVLRRFESMAEESAVAKLPEPGRSLAHLADRLARPSCGGNATELLIDAEATFSRIAAAIGSARDHIHAESYIWRADEAGRSLRDQLVAAARKGVEVRVLVDDVGSRQADRKFFRPLLEAGGRVGRSLRVDLISRRLTLNHRNHRKIVVVDGNVGFTGGLNVGDEYHGRDKAYGPWRDTHLRLDGPGVARLQEIFVEDWFQATKEDLTARRYFPEPAPSGDQRVHILASGPDEVEAHSIATVIFAALSLARERAWITTPYFVPDPPLTEALRVAALRGVDVRLLLPAKVDSRVVHYAATSFYKEALEAGVAIYEYDVDAMLHAKTMTVDGCWATVGSANLDPRSFILNFEANVVVYGPLLARELERVFERDMTRARRVGLGEFGKGRPLLRRGLEAVARVMSPLL